MANQRIEMFQIKRIIELQVSGKSKRLTAELLGISRNTLTCYLSQLRSHHADLSTFLNWEEKALFDLLNKPSCEPMATHRDLLALFPSYAKELSQIGVSRMTLWGEYIHLHPSGVKYRQFCQLFRRWQASQKLSMHLDHKAGDKLFVDFAGDKLHFVDIHTGQLIPVEFFVGILPCSQLTYCQCVVSQKKEDFILALSNCLSYIGGVPQAIVPDNLKAAVIKADRYEPLINETLADLASHYGTSIFPARSRKPKDKALVESAVNILYGRVYAPLRHRVFHSLQELNTAVAQLLEVHNDAIQKEKGCSRRHQFIELEQNSLMPLPIKAYVLKKFCLSKVHPNGHATLKEDKHYYSVPYRLTGKQVKLIYTQETVEIYHDHQRIAIHERLVAKGRYTTSKEHLHPTHQWTQGWSPNFFEEAADKIGENTRMAIDEILSKTKYPENGYRACRGILSFVKRFSAERLEKACSRALHFNHISYSLIKSILESEMDRIDLATEASPKTTLMIPIHDNIRGAEAYY